MPSLITLKTFIRRTTLLEAFTRSFSTPLQSNRAESIYLSLSGQRSTPESDPCPRILNSMPWLYVLMVHLRLPTIHRDPLFVPQIRSDCGWNLNTGERSNKFDESPENNHPREPAWTYSPSSSANSYWDYTTDAGVDPGYSRNYYSGGRSAANTAGPIENGRRHALCGGEYLDNCDLGPYSPNDVGDGSCQQHLNTEGCHYDGGECTRPLFSTPCS